MTEKPQYIVEIILVMCYIFNQLGYIKPSGNEDGCSFFAWPESAMIYFFSYNLYIDTGMIPDFLRRKKVDRAGARSDTIC